MALSKRVHAGAEPSWIHRPCQAERHGQVCMQRDQLLLRPGLSFRRHGHITDAGCRDGSLSTWDSLPSATRGTRAWAGTFCELPAKLRASLPGQSLPPCALTAPLLLAETGTKHPICFLCQQHAY